jgi:2-dehydro-3-deoxyphosphogluconate aldolase/(4S)-4-hydroxy-2-oxoglutarate aldolase
MYPYQASKKTEEICRLAPVIPVLVVQNPDIAKPLAEALISGGLPVLEVTLRTKSAFEVISEMAKVPGGVVGAGTITKARDVKDAINAGANFAVSPGSTDNILEACEQQNLPILPGAATSSEIMRLFDLGYSVQKFFPAEAIGGQSALKAIGGPLPNVKFCPTGGITIDNAKGYLELKNTLCVGGSWITPQRLIENKDWKSITALAKTASKIVF